MLQETKDLSSSSWQREKGTSVIIRFDTLTGIQYPLATPGSDVAMSENAYMTDAVWLEVVPKLCIGILRQMPVIKEHPNWWCMFSLDGFGLHVNVNEAHKIFEAYKIMVVEEEGDTSQVNQAYDQLTAKEDKRLLNVCKHRTP